MLLCGVELLGRLVSLSLRASDGCLGGLKFRLHLAHLLVGVGPRLCNALLGLAVGNDRRRHLDCRAAARRSALQASRKRLTVE